MSYWLRSRVKQLSFLFLDLLKSLICVLVLLNFYFLFLELLSLRDLFLFLLFSLSTLLSLLKSFLFFILIKGHIVEGFSLLLNENLKGLKDFIGWFVAMHIEMRNLVLYKEVCQWRVFHIWSIRFSISFQSSVHINISCPVSPNDFILRKLCLDSLLYKVIFSIKSNEATWNNSLVCLIIIIILFFLLFSWCWGFFILTVRVLNIFRIWDLISFFVYDKLLLSYKKYFLSIDECSRVSI